MIDMVGNPPDNSQLHSCQIHKQFFISGVILFGHNSTKGIANLDAPFTESMHDRLTSWSGKRTGDLTSCCLNTTGS